MFIFSSNIIQAVYTQTTRERFAILRAVCSDTFRTNDVIQGKPPHPTACRNGRIYSTGACIVSVFLFGYSITNSKLYKNNNRLPYNYGKLRYKLDICIEAQLALSVRACKLNFNRENIIAKETRSIFSGISYLCTLFCWGVMFVSRFKINLYKQLGNEIVQIRQDCARTRSNQKNIVPSML